MTEDQAIQKKTDQQAGQNQGHDNRQVLLAIEILEKSVGGAANELISAQQESGSQAHKNRGMARDGLFGVLLGNECQRGLRMGESGWYFEGAGPGLLSEQAKESPRPKPIIPNIYTAQGVPGHRAQIHVQTIRK